MLAGDLARKHGISEATLYNWNAKDSGIDVSDAKRPLAPEDENARLEKLLANQMLEAAALKELLSKNGRARLEARSRRASAGCDGPVGMGPAPSSARTGRWWATSPADRRKRACAAQFAGTC